MIISHRKTFFVYHNTNISHQLLENKITYVNSQLEKTNSKGDFALKNWF